MLGFRGTYATAVALLMVLASQSTCAFSVLPRPANKNIMSRSAAPPSSSTQLGLFNVFNEGKKALVRKLAGDYDQAAIRARLESLIADSKAKELLDAKGAKYTEVDLTKDADGKALRAEMGELIGRTSVPAIWIDGTFIGGCNDGPLGGLVPLNDSGKLDPMLSAAGAI